MLTIDSKHAVTDCVPLILPPTVGPFLLTVLGMFEVSFGPGQRCPNIHDVPLHGRHPSDRG